MVKHCNSRRTALKALTLAMTAVLTACSNKAGVTGPAPDVSFQVLKSATPMKIGQLGKPLLVNFWSTSCPICLMEMPHLAELYKEFKPKGFEMVAVAMSFDQPSAVLELSEKAAWPFLVALDFDDRVSDAFGEVQFTPTAFLIDQNGDFVEKYVGAIDLEKFRKTLAQLTNS